MAVYAIGDIQGCNEELGRLLEAVGYSSDRDRLWLVGDLVNRGPDSLGVLRRVRALGESAAVTLGNHDLHLLALGLGFGRVRGGDTLSGVLDAPDREALLEWLLHRSLLHEDAELGMAMVHAGLAPQWDMARARACAREGEALLRREPARFFARMYGDEPDLWDDALAGDSRMRFIINCFTRLRYVDAAGRLVLKAKGAPTKPQSQALRPWFEAREARWRGARLVFGHWSTLGLFRNGEVTCLDTGCVWGGALTALRLDDPEAAPVRVGCKAHSPIE